MESIDGFRQDFGARSEAAVAAPSLYSHEIAGSKISTFNRFIAHDNSALLFTAVRHTSRADLLHFGLLCVVWVGGMTRQRKL